MKTLLSFVIFIVVTATFHSCKNNKEDEKAHNKESFTTPLGKVYTLNEPSEKMLKLYQEAKRNYEDNPNNVDNIIWFGRRTAYLGKYQDAINIYTTGIKLYPNEPKFYRHRGHRYISQRKYDLAIIDLAKGGELIAGTENEIEPDGLPNAMNIPVSTLHGNIWYHLGLAYYLNHDYEKSYEAYEKCLAATEMPDNVVSAVHWLYMIQRRLGNDSLATKVLEPIESGTIIIENTDYYNLCRFYKGLIPLDSLALDGADNPGSDALKYGVANWYFYTSDKEKAKAAFEEIVSGSAWASFGYIAAESDLVEYFSQ